MCFVATSSENCIKMIIKAEKRPRLTGQKEQGRTQARSNHILPALSLVVSDFAEVSWPRKKPDAGWVEAPEEASEIGVSSNFLEVRVGTEGGVVESLSLKRWEPSQHSPFSSSTGDQAASRSWARGESSTVSRGKVEILDMGMPAQLKAGATVHTRNSAQINTLPVAQGSSPQCGGTIQLEASLWGLLFLWYLLAW